MSRTRLTVVGDCLLDRDVEGEASRFTPDGPAPVLDEREIRTRPGGAGLAAVLAAQDGHEVTLVTALADDDGGRELRRLLATVGVAVVDLGSRGATPEKIRLRADGVSLARWDRGARTGADDIGGWTQEADRAVDGADAVLVSCYGRGVAGCDDVRHVVARVGAPTVWDPHPRGPAPVPGVTLATPNRDEAGAAAGDVDGDGFSAVTRRAEHLVATWGVRGVAVTLGPQGALYTSGRGMPLVAPAPRVATADPCGAGDRFASAAAAALAAGSTPGDAVRAAVLAASRLVATGGAGSVWVGEPAPPAPESAPDDAYAVAEHVRARGGTVVATGGCFDVLHAGHVHVLDAARVLGDCLVVCLNSDASVRRLKGPGRPIVGEQDRADMLRALTAVDGVILFDDDTPVPVLERLRPDVFAKGGDYGQVSIPEAETLAAWGGQAVTLPYLEDRSTTNILEEVRRRAS